MEHYVNMRIKLPHFLHAQLLRKQVELSCARLTSLSLADTAVAVIAEAFLLERHEHRMDGEEELEETNRQEDKHLDEMSNHSTCNG